MTKLTALEKLQQALPASFHMLEPAKAKNMKATTMVLPSPLDVAQAIAKIPYGQTVTTIELQRVLAIGGNAETACPAKINHYWKLLALATEEQQEGAAPYMIPWWRVLNRKGKPSPSMPGGVEAHISRLQAEGIDLAH